MGKITEIKFVGQPIFKQILNLVDRVDITGMIRKHGSDYYNSTAFASLIC